DFGNDRLLRFRQEQGNAGGEAVGEILLANRPQLPLGEEARQRKRPKRLANGLRIVARLRKHSRSPTVAGKEEGPCSTSAAVVPALGQILRHLGIGCFLIANVELYLLAGSDVVSDLDVPRVGVDADYIANQKIALLKTLLVFADAPPDVQRPLHEPLFARRK